MDRYLINNTTKIERKKIIEQLLSFAELVNTSDINTKIFDDYIDGKKELMEIYAELINSK